MQVVVSASYVLRLLCAVLLQRFTLICSLRTHHSAVRLCYSRCAAAPKTPLVLCNSATQLQLLSDGTPNPASKRSAKVLQRSPAPRRVSQSTSLLQSNLNQTVPHRLLARPPLLRLSLTWSAYGGFRCTRKLRNYNIQNATPHCSPRLSM